MGNLFAILNRYATILLFVLLQLICFIFIYNSQGYQTSILINLGNSFSGSIRSWNASLKDYLQLKAQNDSLLVENARLREELKINKFADTFKTQLKSDTIFQQKYLITTAKVVNNTTRLKNNYITLEHAANTSSKNELGVINDKGVIGIVRSSYGNYSSVLSILHKEFSLNAEIVETQQIGTIYWNGKSSKSVTMELPPSQVKFKENQIYHVVSGPYSLVFPRGIPIGSFKLSNVKSENQILISVQLYNDLDNIRYVNIITNRMKNEQVEVEKIK